MDDRTLTGLRPSMLLLQGWGNPVVLAGLCVGLHTIAPQLARHPLFVTVAGTVGVVALAVGIHSTVLAARVVSARRREKRKQFARITAGRAAMSDDDPLV